MIATVDTQQAVEKAAEQYRAGKGWPTKPGWIAEYRDGLMAYEVGYEVEESFNAGAQWAIANHPVVLALIEALEMGAFHHPACPWYNSKECCCAHDKVDQALAEWYGKAERCKHGIWAADRCWECDPNAGIERP